MKWSPGSFFRHLLPDYYLQAHSKRLLLLWIPDFLPKARLSTSFNVPQTFTMVQVLPQELPSTETIIYGAFKVGSERHSCCTYPTLMTH